MSHCIQGLLSMPRIHAILRMWLPQKWASLVNGNQDCISQKLYWFICIYIYKAFQSVTWEKTCFKDDEKCCDEKHFMTDIDLSTRFEWLNSVGLYYEPPDFRSSQAWGQDCGRHPDSAVFPCRVHSTISNTFSHEGSEVCSLIYVPLTEPSGNAICLFERTNCARH